MSQTILLPESNVTLTWNPLYRNYEAEFDCLAIVISEEVEEGYRWSSIGNKNHYAKLPECIAWLDERVTAMLQALLTIPIKNTGSLRDLLLKSREYIRQCTRPTGAPGREAGIAHMREIDRAFQELEVAVNGKTEEEDDTDEGQILLS